MSYSFEDLIECVKKRPEIWQRNHPRFCNTARKISWKEISNELNVSDVPLRRSWHYLVNQYRKELREQTQRQDANSSGWAYFTHMSFLKKEVITRQTRQKMNKLLFDDVDKATISTITQIKPTGITPAQYQRKQSKDAYIKFKVNSTMKRKAIEQAKILLTHFSNVKTSKAVDNCNNEVKSNDNESVNKTDLSNSVVDDQKVSKSDMILQKLDTYTANHNDDDHMFFKSILPMVRTLSPINKLQFRMKINECLLQVMTGCVEPLNNFAFVKPVEEKLEDTRWREDLQNNNAGLMMETMIDQSRNVKLKAYNNNF